MRRPLTDSLVAGILVSLVALAFHLALAFPATARAGEAEAEERILETYRDFAAAQNARDLDRVGAFFIDGPDFLWVSDGQSFWGRDAVLERMGSFQRAEHWRVLPNLDVARVVKLSESTAMLHLPLVLEIGRATTPSRLSFLVSILLHKDAVDWRIAALLTTEDKTGSR